MTREDARTHWARSGLTYDVLTVDSLRRLRTLIDRQMRASGAMRGTLRACQRFSIRDNHPNGKWADLKCKAFYFDDRQAITFEPHGFIGFAGWADDENVRPILSAFCAWVDSEKAANSQSPDEEPRSGDTVRAEDQSASLTHKNNLGTVELSDD